MSAETFVPVIRITNPFNPREFVNEQLAWSPTKSLAEYFPAPMAEVIVSINGKIVNYDEFAVTYLAEQDNLVICPVPTGGGDGKSIFRMVAMIALSVFAPGIGSAIVGAGASPLALGIAQAGVMMAGSLLVNALLPPPKDSKKTSETSSSYGIDGAKNTSLEGICVPVCYGKFRMGGNILGLHVINETDEKQTLYMLMSAGEGEVGYLSNVYLNENPLADYKDVEVQTRLGTPGQSAIPWFNETIVAHNKNQELYTDWFYSTTTTAVDKLRLDFVAPQGLAKVNLKTGATESKTVDLELQYRPAAGGDWIALPTENAISHWVDVIQHIDPVTKVVSWTDAGTGSPVTDPTALEYLATAPLEQQIDSSNNDQIG